MQFILIGFTQDLGFRVFTFEGMGKDQLRTEFLVKADLALTRRYDIPLQELPLMCRGLLERRNEGEEKRTLTFTEDEMCLYARQRAAEREAAAQKRKARRPPSMNIGAAWRGHHP
jgi:hypothetical protein